MQIITSAKNMQYIAEQYRWKGKKIGFVPTMGYLHEGHISLLKSMKSKCDLLVLSIFVNPAQFGENEDFEKYPRNFKRDRKMARESYTDIIYYPKSNDIYPKDFETFVYSEKVSKILEGEFRPTHFKGVTTIVAKLFNIVKPHFAIFGQKDAQQVAIIKKMVHDLNFDVKILIAPIVRDFDGLALSSRNIYLNDEERVQALALNHSLQIAKRMIEKGSKNCEDIICKMSSLLFLQKSIKIDYVKIVDYSSFEILHNLKKNLKIIVLVAAKVGTTRLIDNIVLKT